MTSGSLGGAMVSTSCGKARDVGSIPALGAIFPTLITPPHKNYNDFHHNRRLDGALVSTLSRNARGVGSIPALDAIFPLFVNCYDTGSMNSIVHNACAVWLLNLPDVM